MNMNPTRLLATALGIALVACTAPAALGLLRNSFSDEKQRIRSEGT